jgi:alkylation response protein AidB-like acyl-CoA dehydrogenase
VSGRSKRTAAVDDRDDDLLTGATVAMEASDGPAALDALGWWDLLPHLADDDARAAAVAVFRAQGRRLRGSPALGALLAQPLIEAARLDQGSAVAAIGRPSADGGTAWVVLGDPAGRAVLFDRPGLGLVGADPEEVRLDPIDIPGRAELHDVRADLDSLPLLLGEAETAPARARATYLGRVAAAAEILGAAEQAVALAVEHATVREQFGRPIGTFQAVRHLLAWARTDCTAVDSVLRKAVALHPDPPERYDEVLKALAGRNGRRACERSLQVLGGIGFTAEHDHHHHHSRVLVLDALLGSSAELISGLGAWLRTGGDPAHTTAVLVGR